MSVTIKAWLRRPVVLTVLLASLASVASLMFVLSPVATATLSAQAAQPAATAAAEAGAEANLVLPDLSTVDFRGINGRTLLLSGLAICILGLLFGLTVYTQLKNLPVHGSMREVSELIYETCKTYLVTQ